VTLLALGNGAPDLSSSIAAVGEGHYELAINALLGARHTCFVHSWVRFKYWQTWPLCFILLHYAHTNTHSLVRGFACDILAACCG
jgi:hypothetical protein